MENQIILHEDMVLIFLNGKEFKAKIQDDELVITETTGDIIVIQPNAANRIILK